MASMIRFSRAHARCTDNETLDLLDDVNEVIESSTITKWLFDNNYLYNLLVSTTNLQESISTLIGNFTQAG